MLHIVPRIDDLETRFGFTNNESGQTYVLLGLPSPISGPAFEKYGSSCVGAYVVRVMPSETSLTALSASPSGRTIMRLRAVFPPAPSLKWDSCWPRIIPRSSRHGCGWASLCT